MVEGQNLPNHFVLNISGFSFFIPPWTGPAWSLSETADTIGRAQSCLNCQCLIWEVFPPLDSDLRKAGSSDICPCVTGFSGCFPPSREALATSSSALLGGKLTCERFSPSKFMEHCGFFVFVFSLFTVGLLACSLKMSDFHDLDFFWDCGEAPSKRSWRALEELSTTWYSNSHLSQM